MFLIWLELPLYFIQRKKYNLGVRAFLSEISSYAFMYGMWRWNPKPATFVFLLPFFLLRIGLMVGNWGQHALVDELEPDSDYRSSITLIDVPVSLPPCEFQMFVKRMHTDGNLRRATATRSTTAITQHTISTHVVIGASTLHISCNPRPPMLAMEL